LLLILQLNNGVIPAGLTAWLFFAILIGRWATWSVGRSLRIEEASKHPGAVPYVELPYYAGTILGLSLWVLSGITIIIVVALAAFLCIFGGIKLDWATDQAPSWGATIVVHRLGHRRIPLVAVLLLAAVLTVGAVLGARGAAAVPALLVLLAVVAASICMSVT